MVAASTPPGGQALAHSRSAETAAWHLLRDVPCCPPEASAADALALLRSRPYQAVDPLHVVDVQGRLAGVVPLRSLLPAAPAARVASLMDADPEVVAPALDQEHVASLAVRHDLNSVPVVDTDGLLLGAVPTQAIVAILRREHVEDLHRLAGIARESRQARDALEAAPGCRARRRLPWLLVGLAGSLLAALVVAGFAGLLRRRVDVAYFVPAIVYLADAIGTQTEAIAVRALSLARSNPAALASGELRTGLWIGLVLGLLALPCVSLACGDLRLALAVSSSILLAGGLAASIGLALPCLLARLGVDPAFGSGPLATILQDLLSLLVYLGVATLLLG
ncbi:MAG: magnesium transporter [Planctomycetes bacterium]|nr:magnesium transporter [Planctomycetota bacterium]